LLTIQLTNPLTFLDASLAFWAWFASSIFCFLKDFLLSTLASEQKLDLCA
jgi:hypothetical protein